MKIETLVAVMQVLQTVRNIS